MNKEMEEVKLSRETTEILPVNFRELTAKEAGPILERASRRIDILHVKKNELWQGIQENIDGLKGWIEANGRKLAGKTVRAIAGGAFVVSTLAACSGEVNTPSSFTPTETNRPVAIEVFETPTQVPTEVPTPTEIPVRDEMQISADGLILYNEATLAEGLFTINEAATQYTWDELIRSLYQINVAGENRTFLRQFPTLESFREEALSGRPIENMWIAIDYPRGGVGYRFQATWAPVEAVDLSTIAIEYSFDTYEDVVSGVSDDRPFIDRDSVGGILIERVEINGRQIIRFAFHQNVIYDIPELGILGFSPENYSPEHNLQSATQEILSWLWLGRRLEEGYGAGYMVRYTEDNPPLFNIHNDRAYPSRSEATGFTQDLEHSPFRLR